MLRIAFSVSLRRRSSCSNVVGVLDGEGENWKFLRDRFRKRGYAFGRVVSLSEELGLPQMRHR
eukprot:742153-Lingulodinium_polyedra.AAC.1